MFTKMNLELFIALLQLANDGLGVFTRGRFSTKVTCGDFALSQSSEDSILDLDCLIVQRHMTKHHH